MKHFVNKLTFNAFIAVFIALFGFILIHSGQALTVLHQSAIQALT